MKAVIFEVEGNYLGQIGKVTKTNRVVEHSKLLQAVYFPDFVFDVSMTPQWAIFELAVSIGYDFKDLDADYLKKLIIDQWTEELQKRLDFYNTCMTN